MSKCLPNRCRFGKLCHAHTHSTYTFTQLLIDNTLWIDNTHVSGDKKKWFVGFQRNTHTPHLHCYLMSLCIRITNVRQFIHFNTIINLHFSNCRLGTGSQCDFLVSMIKRGASDFDRIRNRNVRVLIALLRCDENGFVLVKLDLKLKIKVGTNNFNSKFWRKSTF